METLWHSIINVGIVLAAFILAFACFLDKRPVRDSLGCFSAGVLIYGLHVFLAYSDGICEFTDLRGIWQYFESLESCIDSYSLDIICAQVFIIGAALAWLVLAWQPVMRKLEKDGEYRRDEI